MYLEAYEIKLLNKFCDFNLINLTLVRVSNKEVYNLCFKLFYNYEDGRDILFELKDLDYNIINKEELIRMINIFKRKTPRILKYTNENIKLKLNINYQICNQ